MESIDLVLPSASYLFRRIASTYEQCEVAAQLQNCLFRFNIEDQLFAVYANDMYCVAAIELNDKVVVQAARNGNQAISSDGKLDQAFMKWCTKFGLSTAVEEDW